MRLAVHAVLLTCGLLSGSWVTPLSVASESGKAVFPEEPVFMGVPVDDRAAWGRLASQPAVKAHVDRAREEVGKPVATFDRQEYLEFYLTGNRGSYGKKTTRQIERLVDLTIAELVADDGAYLPTIEKDLEAFLSMPTWVSPPHDKDLTNLYEESISIDLVSAAIGNTLALTVNLLGDRLSAELAERVRAKVKERLVDVYLDVIRFEQKRPQAWWVRCDHNWNSVCHEGVVGAALGLPLAPVDKEKIVQSAVDSLKENYLPPFGADGFCTEGLGYWNYGFGQFLVLAQLLRETTDGQVDLMALPNARAAASFPRRYELHAGIYPTFSDCNPGNNRVNEGARDLALALLQPGEAPNSPWEKDSGYWGLSNPAAHMKQYASGTVPLARVSEEEVPSSPADWFEVGQVLVSRGQAGGKPLSVAIKGGDNGGNHNHNDLGSYVVAYGDALLLVDPGMDVYTAKNFGPRRYESSANNSYGHPVPVVDGVLQREGQEAEARVVERELGETVSRITYDLTSGYELEGLEQVRRSLRHDRSGDLIITDAFAAAQPVAFETALCTFSKYSQEGGRLIVRSGEDALEVTATSPQGPVTLHAERLPDGRQKADRIGFRLEGRHPEGEIILTIRPLVAKAP